MTKLLVAVMTAQRSPRSRCRRTSARACSLTIGVGLSDATPGTYRGTTLVVTDIVAAREELVGRGVEVGEIRHMSPEGWKPGPHPDHEDYNSFADFSDPDGNTWVLQERKDPVA